MPRSVGNDLLCCHWWKDPLTQSRSPLGSWLYAVPSFPLLLQGGWVWAGGHWSSRSLQGRESMWLCVVPRRLPEGGGLCAILLLTHAVLCPTLPSRGLWELLRAGPGAHIRHSSKWAAKLEKLPGCKPC